MLSAPARVLNVVLVAPEIPPNTGNVIRLCANTGATLHLVRPLGFVMDDARLRRAGLDYREWADVRVHERFDDLPDTCAATGYAFTTRGTRSPYEARFVEGDWLVFGSETRGLDASVLARFQAQHLLRLPMRPGNRSLNLSNAVAVAVFEAWRQLGFAGAAAP